MSDNIRLLKNYILYFLIGVVICLVGITNVFAASYTYVADIPNVTMQLVETDYASAPIENPYNASYAFGQVLQIDYLVNNYSFSADTNYQLETHFPNQVLTNADTYTVYGLNGESCLISYQSPNTIMNNDHYPRWAFQCPHATTSITISIRNSSNQYLWSGTDIFSWSSAVLSSSSTSLSGSGTDTDNIINNNNQNTQSIINNQNQNAQDIQNTINDTFNSCRNSYNLFEPKLSINGTNIINVGSNVSLNDDTFSFTATATDMYFGQVNNTGNSYSNDRGLLIDVSNSTKIYYYLSNSSFNRNYITAYNSNKISLGYYNAYSSNGSLDLPTGTKYITFRIGLQATIGNTYTTKVMISKNAISDYEKYGDEICLNKLDETNNSINNLNDTINDDDVDDASSEAADFFGDFETDTFGLTSIITAPLNLINSLLSRNCSPLNLPLPYLSNKYLTLPCMYDIYAQHFGALLSLYQAITYGIVAYWVIVRIFNQVKDFKNPEHDEIEVLDL